MGRGEDLGEGAGRGEDLGEGAGRGEDLGEGAGRGEDLGREWGGVGIWGGMGCGVKDVLGGQEGTRDQGREGEG